MKKLFIYALGVCTVLTLAVSPAPIKATDFEGQEDKYMKICSSSNLSNSNLNTCKEFNSYLKRKNKALKNQVNESKAQASDTKANLDNITNEITSLNDDIAQKEAEINYLQTSITNLEASISKKEEELKDRMYSMQSYMNNNSYVEFIFGASDFSDMFSRIESVNELTSYDKELISQLADEKKQVESQKATVVTAKANIEAQRASKKSLQEQFQALYIKQNAEAIAQEKAALQAKNTSEKIDDNLAAFATAVKESEVPSGNVVSGNSEIGNAIANKALSKRGSVYVYGACHSMSEIANPNQSTFDCSGLVSWAFYQAGVNIGSNSTKTLANKGVSVSRSSMQAGDIILFSKNGSASGIHHVGIYIGGGNMVHAPQTGDVVKIASLSSGYYQANWYDVRRLY
ncbi:MAG: NlpC/P60 family protein [Thomasclavelia sp.]|uniref:C40 family peptidase n=1 Tax=Thomasclavelia sp. TaxID=3025757 RepID=UPI0039A3B75A